VDSGKEKAVDSGVEYRDLVSSGALEESLARDLRIGARVNDWQRRSAASGGEVSKEASGQRLESQRSLPGALARGPGQTPELEA
jgi:hypothetical protein